nr:hypothetical protein [Tanacetum cinerariifolium]
GIDIGGSPMRQETIGGTFAQTRSERVLEQPNEPPLTKGHTYGNREGRMEHTIELMNIVPPTPHDSPLTGEPNMDIEDSPKKKRMIEELDKDENVNLVSKQGEVHETAELSKDDNDATLAETLLNIKRSTAKDKEKGIMQETELSKKIKKREMIYSKKQKLDQQTKEEEEDVKAQVDSDQEVEEMKLYMRIVPDEEIAIDAIPLPTKPSVIVEYKIVKEGRISTYHIIRADESTKRYTSMINLLENIDREDLEALWKLVKDKHENTRPEEGYERVL